jgi:antitoxin component of MazEF toxin-antitoxin module
MARILYNTGGVLAVGIPARYAKELEWQAGDEVRVELRNKEIRVWKPVIIHPGR